MGKVKIEHVVSRLYDKKSTVRKEALEDLRTILQQSKGTARIESLGDEGFHQIYEAIYGTTRHERAAYISSSSASSSSRSSAVATRLRDCAAVFRLAVELGINRLRSKTANSVIDHVVQTLPLGGHAFCQPLADDYLKILKTILEHAPHVEHLRDRKWCALVDFLVQSISHYAPGDENASETSSGAPTQSSWTGRIASFRARQANTSYSAAHEGSKYVEDLLLCLDRLNAATNAPSMSRATLIVDSMIGFVNLTSSGGSSHQIAFSCLNSILKRAVTEDTRLAKRVVLELVPVIRRLWASKNALLRDEMLVTLILSEDILKALPTTDSGNQARSSLCNLFEEVATEYSRRHERDILQLDDIILECEGDQPFLSLKNMYVRAEHTRATNNWATISILALLALTVDGFPTQGEEDRINEAPSKRRRLEGGVDDVVRQSLSSSTLPPKMYALQTIPFLLDDSPLLADRFLRHLVQYGDQALDEDPVVAAWTMIAVASIVSTEAASKPEIKQIWLQIWHLGSRNLSSPIISRPAAHLLDCIVQSNVLLGVDMLRLIDTTLFSNGLNGPVGMSDAALALWFTIIDSRAENGQAVIQQIVARLINWLSSHYNFTSVPDRALSKQVALYATVPAFLKLLLLCTNASLNFRWGSNRFVTSPIFKAAFEQHCNAPLSQYLLLAKVTSPARQSSSDRPISSAVKGVKNRNTSRDHAVFEMLLTKVQNFTEAWLTLSKERASNVSEDIIQIVVSLVVLGCVLPKILGAEETQVCRELLSAAHQLWDLVSHFIESSEGIEAVHLIVAAASTITPRSHEVSVAGTSELEGASFIMSSLLDHFHRKGDKADHQERDEMEMMDVEDSFDSRKDLASFDQIPTSVTRQDLPFTTSWVGLQRNIQLQLRVLLSDADAARLGKEQSASPIIDYLIKLKPEDLLASRSSILTYLQSSQISRPNATRLLRIIAEACIEEYDLERCESSLCLCLDVLTALAGIWITNEEDLLHQIAVEMYEWFINVPLGRSLASPRVLTSMAKLLQKILALDPTHHIESLPSSRKSLLQILRSGTNVVKFHISHLVSSIFERYLLTEHTTILEDVIGHLPNDPADIDGIALRLHILAELAARWFTLLRPCIYRIFETAARVSSSLSHAQNCLQNTSLILQIGSVRQLLILFAPQLLYTWLETESLDSIPFPIFGYASLKELIADVQDEVLAQIVMRPNVMHMDRLPQITETSFVVMLEKSFPKAEAYSVARDISMPPSKEKTSKSTESQIRNQVGTDRYLRLVSSSFTEIVAILFTNLGDEHDIERSIKRHPEFGYAATNWQSICQLSCSNLVLPPRQQPFFRAKYLLDEVDFLCRRIGKPMGAIWTAPLVVYVGRSLLDSMTPALGSLHACSVLRKLRALVAFAGQEAQHGYALEMLLQALQPYLTQFYCVEDAIGLFWYLLDGGRIYLQKNLTFLCGVALTTLLSLSTFSIIQKDDTIQDSHYLTSLSIAASFHKWFGDYLVALPLQDCADKDARSFKALITYAREFKPPGRADKNTTEGKLVLELLEARVSELTVLSAAAFKSTMQILCGSFHPPTSWKEDILGQDSLAIRHAGSIWTLLGNAKAAQSFCRWSGEALGRSYAACGTVEGALTREHSIDLFQPWPPGTAIQLSSRSVIARSLRDLLLSHDQAEVSIAEKTLGLVMTRLASQKALDDYGEFFGPSLTQALNWHPSRYPQMTRASHYISMVPDQISSNTEASTANWASQFMVSLTSSVKDDALLDSLPPILTRLPGLAPRIMPFIIHNYLQTDKERYKFHRQTVSQALRDILVEDGSSSTNQQRLALRTLLYLRTQPSQEETTIADRVTWLDIDFAMAATAAISCAMYKSALLLLELQVNTSTWRPSRRSSVAKSKERPDLLRKIYQGLDDPDFFYAMQEEASLDSVLRQLGHEGDNFKNLSFQSALFDSSIKCSDRNDASQLLNALSSANINGVAQAVHDQLSQNAGQGGDPDFSASLTALNLHQWDVPVISIASDPLSVLYQALRTANTSANTQDFLEKLHEAFVDLVKPIAAGNAVGNILRKSMSVLAALTETKEMLCARGFDELHETLLRLQHRDSWQETENFEQISLILAGREAFFSTLKKQQDLSELMRLGPIDCHILEVSCVRHSLKLARSHSVLQPALNRAMFLSTMVKDADALGIGIGDLVLQDFAGVLWDQGDMTASIEMLRQVKDSTQSHMQRLSVSRPGLLADMGYRIAHARLERPDEIIKNYLLPAIQALQGEREGEEVGRVYHAFAQFCDQQLQNADGLDEFSRVVEIREQREAEVKELERMVKNADGKQKQQLSAHHTKAKQWYKLDDAEFQRLKRTRENFLQQTLENYLLSLRASDEFANDVLRFCAIWLDNSSNSTTNTAVGKYIAEVPSRKFVPLMNQLSSRLLDIEDEFQECLFRLLLRICEDHPFHGMYQVFASSKSKGGKDDLALSRHAAANRLSDELRRGPASNTWVAVHNSSISFIRFALEHLPNDSRHKSGSKVPLTRMAMGAKLVQEISNLTNKIPPPTLKIPIRADCNYQSLPVLQQFGPQFTVAGGVSAPKIITMTGSDGNRMRALLKGGNDDLRQDSIMEQVFEQVSNLLKDHRETRQRQLGIRSYKVLPLTMNAGIIEFVSGTVPLHDYSMPAHPRYHPRDWKPNKCRKEIDDAQSRSLSTRIQTFRTVCDNFQPVLRHFFFERFLDPDDWFAKRLAYSRSTAAISILGHILGLGDRHGHNILLDEETGEVVHIDLGVAFEAGRVLPVPEVVPFRLTRDIVDGMGISGVEGVFRRCCNFTLEALREDHRSIMTILDVLRYDPLYSWSISPLRQQRMQENKKLEQQQQQQQQRQQDPMTTAITAEGDPVAIRALANKKPGNNPSEADRALTVVARKLGKSLSVEATVNELIQQAMDERNLAVLYCGWAAYA